MSDTSPIVPPIKGVVLTAPVSSQAGQVDIAVAAARNLPALLTSLATIAPSLPAFLAGKSLVAARTPYVTVLVTILTYASTRYGLGWDDTTVNTITGIVLFAVSLGMRCITSTPVTGFFSRAKDGLLSKSGPVSNAVVPATVPAAKDVVPVLLIVWLAGLGLSACATPAAAPPPTTVVVTTPSQTTAGRLYAAYNTADSAWLAYLQETPQTAAKARLVAKVSPYRLQARKAIDAFATASLAGAATDQAAAAQAAVQLFVVELTAGGINL
jgi:hypothetical protein